MACVLAEPLASVFFQHVVSLPQEWCSSSDLVLLLQALRTLSTVSGIRCRVWKRGRFSGAESAKGLTIPFIPIATLTDRQVASVG